MFQVVLLSQIPKSYLQLQNKSHDIVCILQASISPKSRFNSCCVQSLRLAITQGYLLKRNERFFVESSERENKLFQVSSPPTFFSFAFFLTTSLSLFDV